MGEDKNKERKTKGDTIRRKGRKRKK